MGPTGGNSTDKNQDGIALQRSADACAADPWKVALSEIRAKISSESFDTWLAPIQFGGILDGTVLLRIPNRFYADWIRAHYVDLITRSLCSQTGKESLEVKWEIDERLLDRSETSPDRIGEQVSVDSVNAPVSTTEKVRRAFGLNPKYVFDNFVVGPSNQLAHAACFAAASNPGKRYNPLFIYGGVGLGKTHLVNAMGHRMLEARPSARILYVSAERFTNEFISALQNHRINEFRERYRNQCDAVLIDDIQFLATREQTQEEFFHTFNSLYHADKQIVVSCDVFPQQIREMQERLVSRFQWGMIADIQAPELDTRIAIVRKKADQEGISLPFDVAAFIAETVKSNVRELEGSLLRLAVRAELLDRPIDIQLARESLRSLAVPTGNVKTVEDIQQAVCEYYNVRLAQLKSHGRQRSIAKPRMNKLHRTRTALRRQGPHHHHQRVPQNRRDGTGQRRIYLRRNRGNREKTRFLNAARLDRTHPAIFSSRKIWYCTLF
jgi:chromosomal replication initiator protein